ncbi:hypothetical protein EJ02DRAFT_122684 [Clathrospora elynae]|uniref:Uncharacterized protein n=1 Tax=Clathrospora elynae TaxID=706981 RepID=A0A6A5SWY0_9PLEO|nr:hypothetical protein EJ02DRAFT_122684 [Clathrospora elynae]
MVGRTALKGRRTAHTRRITNRLGGREGRGSKKIVSAMITFGYLECASDGKGWLQKEEEDTLGKVFRTCSMFPFFLIFSFCTTSVTRGLHPSILCYIHALHLVFFSFHIYFTALLRSYTLQTCFLLPFTWNRLDGFVF